MSYKPLYIECQKCKMIYDFGRIDKSTDTFYRNVEKGDQCHRCFSEYCIECSNKQTRHSLYDDANICNFKNCVNVGMLYCINCVPIPENKKLLNNTDNDNKNNNDEDDTIFNCSLEERSDETYYK